MNCKFLMKQNSCFFFCPLSLAPWHDGLFQMNSLPQQSASLLVRVLASTNVPMSHTGTLIRTGGVSCFSLPLWPSGYGRRSWEQPHERVPHYQPASLMTAGTVCSLGSVMLQICFPPAIFCCLYFAAWQTE